MIVDSSVLVAILRGEPEARDYARSLTVASHVKVSAATVLETTLVLGASRAGDIDELLLAEGMEVVPFDTRQLGLARSAHRTFGRGSGSRARLNFGDCFSYALAKATGETLLFKGDDFGHTDITPAR